MAKKSGFHSFNEFLFVLSLPYLKELNSMGC